MARLEMGANLRNEPNFPRLAERHVPAEDMDGGSCRANGIRNLRRIPVRDVAVGSHGDSRIADERARVEGYGSVSACESIG